MGRTNKYRPRLSQDEMDVVNSFRRIKNEANENGLNDHDVKHGWIKTDNASLFFRNPNFGGSEDNQNKFIDDLLTQIKNHAPEYREIKRNEQ